MQMNNVSVSLWLDKRRIKKGGRYPVKLRVFTAHPKKQMLYSIEYQCTEYEFAGAYQGVKAKIDCEGIREDLDSKLVQAKAVIKSMKQFSFDGFEREFFQKNIIDATNVFALFNEVIKQKLQMGAVSTAEKYTSAKRAVQKYLEYKSGKSESTQTSKRNRMESLDGKYGKLSIDQVNAAFLSGFSNYCQSQCNSSVATVAIHLRNLRSVYQLAMLKNAIAPENYPFGRLGFSIPSGDKVNKALTKDQLKLLWNTEPVNENQAKAKDFWFFSYYSYGMNTKDICELKYTKLENDSFEYVRAKTRTTRIKEKKNVVPLTQSMKQIIERRKVSNSEFVFGIISGKDNPKQKHEKIKRFNNAINKHFREYALFAGIDPALAKELGTYHARHSFATIAVRAGVSIALFSEILHDGNLEVTQGYLDTFKNEDYKKLSSGMEL